LSHVNDSGFWLVSKYLGLDEKQTFRSWTVMTTILALVGFGAVCLLSLVL
jgi:Gnt-I system low-affinity gluconate transporter